MSEEEKQHHPVGDFFKGVLLGCFILIFIIVCSIFLSPLLGNIFWVVIVLAIAIPIAIGIYIWIRWKRKFIALGLFLSLPIIAFIFLSICGAFLY